jgi:hypothetical protein
MLTLSRSRVVGVGLALLVSGAVIALWPREAPSLEEAIRRKIIEMTRLAEEKDISGLMEGVSERFKAKEGWGKEQVRGVLAAQVLRGQWVRIFLRDLSVTELSPTQVEFSAKFVFGRSEAQLLEQLAQETVLSIWEVSGTFEKEQDGEWRVVVARNRRLEPKDLFE